MARAQFTVETSVRALPHKKRLLVAVSGGIDSCVLLHAVWSAQRLLQCELHVAHVDHGLRSKSAKDCAFVADLATRYELPFHSLRLGKLPARVNLESWARQQRYTFFEELRQREGLDWVLTAHQANDVAETFLMRILSNREPRTIVARDPVRRLLRPLLLVSRANIERYAQRHKLNFVADDTNADPSFMRNRVRLKLLPLLLKEYDLGSIENLTRRALACAADLQLLEEQALVFNGVLEEEPLGSRAWLRLLRTLLAQIPEALAWRVIERALLPELGFRIGRDRAHSVLDFLAGNGTTLRLPAGRSLVRSNGAILIKSTT